MRAIISDAGKSSIVSFEALDIGDWFTYGNGLWLVIDKRRAVDARDGITGLFEPGNQVQAVQVTITVVPI